MHSKYICQPLAVTREQYGRKKHPEQFYKITEKMSTHRILKQAVDIHKGN
jgi:hypothetical protein